MIELQLILLGLYTGTQIAVLYMFLRYVRHPNYGWRIKLRNKRIEATRR